MMFHHHPARLKSACLAAGVHGLALMLALIGWRGVPSVPHPGQGLQVTTLALAPSPDAAPAKAGEAKRSAMPEQPHAVRTPRDTPPVTAAIPSPPLIVSDLARPAAIGDTGGAIKAEHGEGPAGGAPPATAPHDPQGAAAGSPPGEAAPAKSAITYAIRVFRHIHEVKDFPAHLARTGIGGRVLIRFNITPRGEATDIAVAMSSGIAALDALALEQIRSAIPYPLPPRELQAAQRQFLVPMTYRPAS